MAVLKDLETNLNDMFTKNTPKLPANARKTIVEYLPWINLVLGLLALWAAYTLWHWAHLANGLVDYANRLSAAYGGPAVAADRLSLMVWVGLAVLTAQAV